MKAVAGKTLGRALYSSLKHIARIILPENWFNSLGWRVGALRARGRWEALKKIRLEPPRLGDFAPGINLIGYFDAPSGMGESVRLLAEAIKAAEERLAIIPVQPPPEPALPKPIAPPSYDINIIHINPPELPVIFSELGSAVWAGHYNVGFWLWELEEFPPQWQPAFNLFNELWVPSEFISHCLRKSTNIPIVTMPYGLSAEYDPACGRDFFGLPPDKFLFLTAADGFSILDRKNPLGAVQAYAKAFEPNDKGVGLVIKVRNASFTFIDQVKTILNGYPNIFYLTEEMNKQQVNSLIKHVDAFVSLHRAEGFGLVLAEAMLLDTPCVATNWSSNTEFMTPETAALVDYRLVELTCTIGPYRRGQRWADPNLNQAADHMRRLYSDASYCKQLANKAKVHLGQKLNRQVIARRMQHRITQIRNTTMSILGPSERN